jgi:hypothetical protein
LEAPEDKTLELSLLHDNSVRWDHLHSINSPQKAWNYWGWKLSTNQTILKGFKPTIDPTILRKLIVERIVQ